MSDPLHHFDRSDVSCTLETTSYRGDHEAEVQEAHELLPGETVVELVARLLWSRNGGHVNGYHDRVVLRLVRRA